MVSFPYEVLNTAIDTVRKGNMKSKKVEEAKQFAKRKHAHLTRKDGKTPSWKHLVQVYRRLELMDVKDDNVLSAGWLHDIIEDTDVSYDVIKERFGSKVADIVSWLSKDNRLAKTKREKQYREQLRQAPVDAQVVKLADITANLADLENAAYDKKKKAEQVKQKVKYIKLIKSSITKKKKDMPGLQKVQDELNSILESYGMKKEF